MATLEQIVEQKASLSEAIEAVRERVVEAHETGDEMSADLLEWYTPGTFPTPDGNIGKIAVDGHLYCNGYGEPYATATIKAKGKKPVSIEFDQSPARGEKLIFTKGKKGKKTWSYGEGQPAPNFVVNTLVRLGMDEAEG